MATEDFELVDPPKDRRDRELWLQHTAGFILFESVRGHALEQMDPELPTEIQAAVRKGIDDAVYGLMMVIDGVTGNLKNSDHQVSIDFIVRLETQNQTTSEDLPSELDLHDGDGMCMGYHSWLEGDFGKNPVAIPRPGSE